jgi:inosine-uridine nucleoside N-ribohydrolase
MPRFPVLDNDERLVRLAPPRATPANPLPMALDTDTYNEIDDQFALTYALLSIRLNVEAVYAAPFFNNRSTSPGDGMARSYAEIIRVMDRLGLQTRPPVFRGSESYLGSPDAPVPSPAVDDLVRRALAPREGPLYVVAIGAITNVASALLAAPEIVRRIVVVWLGGEPHYWSRPQDRAFNLYQDVPAARVVFDSGVPLVHVPCTNVSEHLRSTLPEMAHYVRGKGPVGDYLYEIFASYYPDNFARSKVIWDIATIAYCLNPDWTPSELRPSPILNDDLTWGPVNPTRHPVREVVEVDRDAVFGDLFRLLAARAGE